MRTYSWHQNHFILIPCTYSFLFAAAAHIPPAVATLDCTGARSGVHGMLQPKNVCLHGAGQDAASFRAYWNAMPNDTKPAVFMTYTHLNATSRASVISFFSNLEAECASYGDTHYTVPQIGLSMSHTGKGYDGAVAAGDMDEQIGWLVDALNNTLQRPAYVRIGFEFNGEWNGYSASTYKPAFERVAKAIRATKKVATVWDFSADAAKDRLDWKNWTVNADLMDWAGINIFSNRSQPTAPTAGFKGSPTVEGFLDFITGSGANRIGVMIGESTPRLTGARNKTSWGEWFAPYFAMFDESKYNLQSLNYINWDWSNSSEPYYEQKWANWGDARIQGTAVQAKMVSALRASKFVHAQPKDTLLGVLGCRSGSAVL